MLGKLMNSFDWAVRNQAHHHKLRCRDVVYLMCLAELGEAITLSLMAGTMNINVTTAYRWLGRKTKQGYVQHVKYGTYSLSPLGKEIVNKVTVDLRRNDLVTGSLRFKI